MDRFIHLYKFFFLLYLLILSTVGQYFLVFNVFVGSMNCVIVPFLSLSSFFCSRFWIHICNQSLFFYSHANISYRWQGFSPNSHPLFGFILSYTVLALQLFVRDLNILNLFLIQKFTKPFGTSLRFHSVSVLVPHENKTYDEVLFWINCIFTFQWQVLCSAATGRTFTPLHLTFKTL